VQKFTNSDKNILIEGITEFVMPNE